MWAAAFVGALGIAACVIGLSCAERRPQHCLPLAAAGALVAAAGIILFLLPVFLVHG